MIGNKTKILTTLVVTVLVFLVTFFALAQNPNGNSVFLDSDQDGLTDQEEKALGTDPNLADTDHDGYSDAKELESGFNPLVPAPGDKLIAATSITQEEVKDSDSSTSNNEETQKLTDPQNILESQLQDESIFTNFESSSENPNLTNEMIGELMALTKEKGEVSSDFLENPTFSEEDLSKITASALESAKMEIAMPEIRDEEIKILSDVSKSLNDPEEVKEEEKKQIEKYLASLAFVFVANSAFDVTSTGNLEPQMTAESDKLLAAVLSGDSKTIDAYAERAKTSIKQLKEVETPYLLKDLHKSIIALSIYVLELKDEAAFDPNDPMKGLAAMSLLQTVSQSALKIQEEMSQVFTEYEIDSISLN